MHAEIRFLLGRKRVERSSFFNFECKFGINCAGRQYDDTCFAKNGRHGCFFVMSPFHCTIFTISPVTLVHEPHFSTSYAKFLAKNRIKFVHLGLWFEIGDLTNAHNNTRAHLFSYTPSLTKSRKDSRRNNTRKAPAFGTRKCRRRRNGVSASALLKRAGEAMHNRLTPSAPGKKGE